MEPANPLLEETGRGLTVVYRGRHLYSLPDPRAGAERRARAAPQLAQTLYLVPSPLLFHGMETLLARLEGESCIVCVEMDERLMALSLEQVAGALLTHPKITFVRTSDVSRIVDVVRGLGLEHFRRCVEVRLSGGYSLSAEFYRMALEAIKDEIASYWRNRMTLIQSASQWISNILTNFTIFPEANDLAAYHIDRPVVLAGAGESIEGAMPILRRIRSKVYLLAVDTALPALGACGLKADGMIVLESHAANVYDLLGADIEGVEQLADISSHPEVIRARRGPLYLFSSQFASTRLFERMGAASLMPMRIPALGSVGVAAFYCARALCQAPIFLAGLDFSFQPGKTHARGAAVHRRMLATWSRISPPALFSRTDRAHLRVAGKRGVSVITDPVLYSYHRILASLLAGETRVYDLGASGLVLGVPRLESSEEALRVIREWVTPPADPLRSGNSETGRRALGSRKDAAAFLDRELLLLAQAIGSAEAALRGDVTPASGEAMALVDYVALHFPDALPFSTSEPGYLRRFIESADSYSRTIRRALLLLGAG